MPTTTVLNYTTQAEIYNQTGSTGAYLEQMSTNYDSILGTIITRVSRAIDNYTLTRFFTSTGDEVRTWDGPPWRPDFSGTYGPYAYAAFGWAGTRRFFPSFPIASITTLQLANGTFDAASTVYTTIDSRDYFLEPSDRRDGWPADWLEISDAPIGTYSTAPFMWFSPGYNTVKITGKFGWATTGSSGVPDDIRQVAVEETIRLFKSRDASFADIAGVAELSGTLPYSKFLSARSRMILDSYRRQPLP